MQTFFTVSENIFSNLAFKPAKSSFFQYSSGVSYPFVTLEVSESQSIILPSLTAITKGTYTLFLPSSS